MYACVPRSSPIKILSLCLLKESAVLSVNVNFHVGSRTSSLGHVKDIGFIPKSKIFLETQLFNVRNRKVPESTVQDLQLSPCGILKVLKEQNAHALPSLHSPTHHLYYGIQQIVHVLPISQKKIQNLPWVECKIITTRQEIPSSYAQHLSEQNPIKMNAPREFKRVDINCENYVRIRSQNYRILLQVHQCKELCS